MKDYANLCQFNSLSKMLEELPDETACRNYIEHFKWNGNPECPYCGENHPYKLTVKKEFKGMYKCSSKYCSKRFTVTTNSMFEGSHIPLRKWFIAMYIFSTHKKGISSHQLASDLGLTQKTAWFLLHRIRRIMVEQQPELMAGTIQVDETFVGGKNKNRHRDKKVANSQGRAFIDKTPVLGILSIEDDVRKVRCFVIPDTKAQSIQPHILMNVQKGSTLYSDEWWAYNGLYKVYNHGIVDHGRKQYKNGDVCTNGIEGFWSHFKRGLIGIYHQVSPKHLQKYADEFAYRYNTRNMTNNGVFNLSLHSTQNNRLMYKQLIART